MALSFETKMVRVGELFADASVFDMPPFQRSFCWDEEMVAQLFDDIHSAMVRGQPNNGRGPNKQDYFLGPIIVTQKLGDDAAEVIDGQQRLAVLTILLALIRDKLPIDDAMRDELQDHIIRPERDLRRIPKRPRVQLRSSDQEHFAAWVQQSGATKRVPDDHEDDSCAKILDAIHRLRSDLGICEESYLAALATFVLTNCYVIQVKARSLDDGYVLFRSLNSRGQPLNELDLAKAELLGGSQHLSPMEIATLGGQWQRAEKALEREAFEEYIRAILSLITKEPQGRELRDLMKEVLRDHVEARNFRVLLASVLRHAGDLEDSSLDFKDRDDNEQINRAVSCLKAYPLTEWRSVALPWLATNPTAYHTLQFFRALDGLCLGMLILGKNRTQMLKRLKWVAVDVVNHREEVLSRIGHLRFTQAEQTQLIAAINQPISSRKKFLKTLLLRLNVKKQASELPIYFPQKLTLEHVLPQRPSANGPWLRLYPDARRRKHCTSLLGNYALLAGPINTGAKNKAFADKLKIILGKRENQVFAITAGLATYREWSEEELMERHRELVADCLELLGLPPIMAMSQAAE